MYEDLFLTGHVCRLEDQDSDICFLEEYHHIFRSVKNDQWKFQKSFFPQYEQCKDAKGFREPEGCQII